VMKIENEHRIKGLEKTISDKSARSDEAKSAASEAAKAEMSAKKLKEERETDKRESVQYLADMNAAYEKNQKTRKDEVEALTKAIEIFQGNDIAAAKEHIHGKGGKSKVTNFLQISSSVKSMTDSHKTQLLQKVASLIQKKNSSLFKNKSRALSLLSAEMLSSQVLKQTGTFDKVIDMVKSLISKLEAEAASETTHVQWCKVQTTQTTEDKEKYTEKVEKIQVDLDTVRADMASLQQAIKEATENLLELKLQMTEAQKIRDATRIENENTIADSKAGQGACEKALEILNTFYAQKEALVQIDSLPQPLAAYGGLSDSSTGVIGLIQTIASDFARLEADVTSEEQHASSQHKTYVAETKVEIETIEDNVHQDNVTVIQKKDVERRKMKELKSSQAQLSSILRYDGELQPLCTAKHLSYEERKAAREQEIAALREAYDVLADEMAA